MDGQTDRHLTSWQSPGHQYLVPRTHRHTHSQTDRQMDRQTDRHCGNHQGTSTSNLETHKHTDSQTDRQTLCQSPGHGYLGPRTHTDIMRDILTVKIDLEDIETSVHQLPGHTYHELVKYSLLINKNVLQVHISCLCRVGRFVLKLNKKLSCRTEAA